MKVAVIGSGYVGLVTGACFAELGHQVIGIDCDEAKINSLQNGQCPIYEPGLEELIQKNLKSRRLEFTSDIKAGVQFAEIVFIAVGTPARINGEADLSQIERVSRQVAAHLDGYKLIVEKSTVPVWTGERMEKTIRDCVPASLKFDIASNPEFLREGSAIYDFMHPDRIVIGVKSRRADLMLRKLYQNIPAEMIVTDINSAELIKHASNSFLAMKISFINAVARICDLVGADVRQVALGMGLDKRIGQSFLNAGLGFGGSCFPKDLRAFIHIAEKLGYDFPLLEAVDEINKSQIDYFLSMVEDHLWNIDGKVIAVWGLAFKPNTDDMRAAPSVPILDYLRVNGAKIRAHDPKAMEKAKEVLPHIEYVSDFYEACQGSDCLLILTDWDEYKKADMRRVKGGLKFPIVIDGRNIFDPKQMTKQGFHYSCVGRPNSQFRKPELV